jgi:hypothetical protein
MKLCFYLKFNPIAPSYPPHKPLLREHLYVKVKYMNFAIFINFTNTNVKNDKNNYDRVCNKHENMFTNLRNNDHQSTAITN